MVLVAAGDIEEELAGPASPRSLRTISDSDSPWTNEGLMDPSMTEATTREISHRDEPGRRRALDYPRSLSVEAPSGVTGSSLLSFEGSVPDTDMAEIEAAIAGGCEHVNPGIR